MSCNPHEWLDLAQELAVHKTEVGQRSAISRAYYAAHHAVQKTFPEVHGQRREKTESSHVFVIRRVAAYAADIKNVGRKEAGVIAERLNAARYERNAADYHVDEVFPPYAVAQTLRKAVLILDLCKKIKNLQNADAP